MDEEGRLYPRAMGDHLAARLSHEDPAATFSLADAARSLAREAGLTVEVREPAVGQIYGALIGAMRAVGAVAKDGVYQDNRGTQYNFRGVDAVVNACGPALREAGVLPVPIVDTITRTAGTTQAGGSKLHLVARVTYRFTAADGSHLDVVVEGEASDTSDKGTGKVMSVAYRIALLQLFAIPTHDVDPDATRIEGDHTPPLSAATVAYVIRAVQTDPIERLEPVWRLLVAHVPPDAPIPGEADGTVWWEFFAERYRREVDEAAGKEALADLWKKLGQFGRTFKLGGEDVGERIKARNAALVKAQQDALKEARDLIEAAEDAAGCDLASDTIKAHLAAHTITAADGMIMLESLTNKREEIAQREAEAARQAIENEATDADPADENYDGEGPQ
mgnify:CR=1 FL=1